MSRALEEGVIGTLLMSNDFREFIFSIGKAEYFRHYGYIFKEAYKQHEEGIYFTDDTLEATLGSQNGLLLDIQFNGYVSEERITDAIKILQDAYESINLVSELSKVIADSKNKSAEDLLSEIDAITKVDVAKSETSLTPSEILAREEGQPKKEKLLTGIRDIDDKLFEGAGTCKGDVLTLLAESGHGKTQGALFLASKWARNNYKGAWFQLEDYDVNTANALVSTSLLSADNIFINDQLDEINAIKRECMRLKHHYGLDFVVIDYMQIVKIRDDRKRASKTIELEDISGVIKDIAKKLNVVVVVTSQASVDKLRTAWSRIPRVDDAKWAQSIKEMSHAIVSVFRPNMIEGIKSSKDMNGNPYIILDSDRTMPFNSVIMKKRKDRRAPLYLEFVHLIHTEDMGLQMYEKRY